MTSEFVPLHIRTPLMYSSVLSNQVGAHVYLKLENTQPSGSFKSRGIGHLAQRSIHPLGPAHTHLICSSGGNAGLACAHAALALGTKCTIFVPTSAPDRVIAKLKTMGANVVQGGAHWAEADAAARKGVEELEGGVYVPPFDHPLIPEGHATLLHELDEQLREQHAPKVAAVICSVGGGGLLAGTLKGMSDSEGRLDCPILAVETSGAASFAASLRASHAAGGKLTMVRLSAITTIASTLGASQVSNEVVERALAHKAGVVSVVMEDARAVDAVRRFTDDHAFFVEPACAVSLAPIYEPAILRAALPEVAFAAAGEKPPADAPAIVVVVCGGTTISLELYNKWEKEFAASGNGLGPVKVTREGVEAEVRA